MALLDALELNADRAGDELEHRAPGPSGGPWREEQRLRRVGLAEPHHLEHRERVVPGVVVDDLHHPHAAHLLAERSEEHTSELQSLMRTSYAVFCLKKKKTSEHTMK